MDPSPSKFYSEHGFDSRQWLEQYFSDASVMNLGADFLEFPMKNLTKTFAEGHIKGDVLIDLSIGSMIHQLYAACEFFEHIIILKIKDRCILELKRWVDSRTGAFDWQHAAKLHVDIEGKCEHFQDKEEKVRSAAHHVVKCDLTKENILDPMVLPPADCVITFWLLGGICKHQDDYIRNLGKISKLMKPGGHIIITGILGTTYYTVGKDKLHGFCYHEGFVKEALVGVGFVIDRFDIKERTAVSDLIDYKHVMFVVAHKEK
ncbi:indolethylamine N-methyltransferase-like isoform 2-T2 [Anomaloglossus baeobatrachus]|uniref:indolethylamine N-methyltransferase-like isoform X2 n=1 Tax=Anomaloglossus baeobatrachus TaxID=238106 RepID=UPI003F5032E1